MATYIPSPFLSKERSARQGGARCLYHPKLIFKNFLKKPDSTRLKAFFPNWRAS